MSGRKIQTLEDMTLLHSIFKNHYNTAAHSASCYINKDIFFNLQTLAAKVCQLSCQGNFIIAD